MLESAVLTTYLQLKSKKNSAYKMFKKDPTTANSSKYMIAIQTFNNFCLEVIATLAGDYNEAINKQKEILANFEKYSTCSQCNTEILFQTDLEHYIASSDFIEDVPGWCYNCLVAYCPFQDCETCTISDNPVTCSFKDIKNSL